MSEQVPATQIVLEPAQYAALAEIAVREGRSVADEVREIVRRYLDEQQATLTDHARDDVRVTTAIAEIRHTYQATRQRATTMPLEERLAVLEQIRQHREAILVENGGQPLDFDVVAEINQMREERDAEILGTPFDAGD